MKRSRSAARLIPVIGALFIAGLSAQTSRPGLPQPPARDTPVARKDNQTASTALIAGIVIGADDGSPVKRALVSASSPELQEERTTLSDDHGAFELKNLPSGRYTVTAFKTGYVTLSYGQRRPLQAGTPLDVSNGQQLRGVEMRLPRGAVVAGHVFDPDNTPMAGVFVQVMRYQYNDGARTLMPDGNAQTDDTGAFRIWGLNPGDYYVSAVAKNFTFERPEPGPEGVVALTGPDLETRRAYLPTYFPGVASVNQARRLRLGVGEQSLDVNFNLQLVRTARVTGFVSTPSGVPAASGTVSLVPELGSIDGQSPLGLNFGARIDQTGRFTLENVPPDRYVLRARGGPLDVPQYAMQLLSVASDSTSDVSVVLAPGAAISGRLTFEGKDPPEPGRVSLIAPSAEGVEFPGSQPKARIGSDGQFGIEGIPAGGHYLRSDEELRGWALKAVLVDNRDVTDTPIELRSGQRLPNVTLVFSNKQGEINGTITNERSAPVIDFTVLAFPVEPSLWRPRARQFMTARPDQNGAFTLRGLPPGDYYLVAVDVTEQGEWFEPAFLEQQRASAARVSIQEGDVKTQNFRVSTR